MKFLPVSRIFSGVLLSVLICFQSGFAQVAEVVRGRVVDSAGSPVAGAAVDLRDRNGSIQRQVVTSDDGTFSFAVAGSGEYLVSVSAINFRKVVRNVNSSDSNPEIKLDVDGIDDQVVVTASGTPQTVIENSRAFTVVTAEDIDRRDESLVAEALRSTPGLRVNQRGGPGGFTSLRFRGLRTADTSVLIDGLRLRDAAGFRGDFGSLFSDLMTVNLDRVEVVRGSLGPLYGTAATGGVLNLVTRTGAGRPRFDVGFEGGTLSQFRERFNVAGGAREKFSYSAGVSRTDVNRGIDGNDVFRNTSLGTRLAYQFTPNASLGGSLVFSDSPNTTINSNPFPVGPAGNEFGYETGKGPVTDFVTDLDDPDAKRTSRLFAGWVSYKQRVNDVWSFSASYQGTRSKRGFSNGTGQHPRLSALGLFDFPFEISRFDGTDQAVETRHTLQLGRNNLLTLGFEHERESFDQDFASSAFGIASNPTTDRQNSTAFFLNDQVSLLNRKLQFGFGFRAQRFDIDNPRSVPELKNAGAPNAYTGDGSISYYVERTGTKLRAHVGNSFRAPSLSERFSNIVTSGGVIRIGNPSIRPERALNVDAGIDQTLADGKLRVSGTYFYSRLQEVIVSTTFLKEVNARGGLARGAEVEVEAAPMRGLNVRFAYTHTRSDFVPTAGVLRSDNTFAPANIARRQQGIPDHQTSVGINYALSRWNFNFDFTGISDYEEFLFSPNFFQPVLFKIDGYKKADVGASYTLPLRDETSLRFFTKIDNVFRNRFVEDGFRTPGVVALGGVKFQF